MNDNDSYMFGTAEATPSGASATAAAAPAPAPAASAIPYKRHGDNPSGEYSSCYASYR